jgi:1,4-dihydroxy-2-naphthoate octaprenyltransferase
VRIGDRNTRWLYLALLGGAFVIAASVAALSHRGHWAGLALLAAPLTVRPIQTVIGGATGRDLIAVLRDTARLQLVYAIALTVGLALR